MKMMIAADRDALLTRYCPAGHNWVRVARTTGDSLAAHDDWRLHNDGKTQALRLVVRLDVHQAPGFAMRVYEAQPFMRYIWDVTEPDMKDIEAWCIRERELRSEIAGLPPHRDSVKRRRQRELDTLCARLVEHGLTPSPVGAL